MRVLVPVAINSVTASSEKAANPDNWLLLDSPRIRWEALDTTVTSAYVDVAVVPPISGLVVVGVQAATCTVTTTAGAALAGIQAEKLDDDIREWDNYWFSFNEITGSSMTLRVNFTKSGSLVIAAGCIQVGRNLELAGVQYPLQESMRDTSMLTELASGNYHYRNRDRVRSYQGTMLMSRATDYTAWRSFARYMGGRPGMYYIAPAWGEEWFCYGRMLEMPAGSHQWPTLSVAQFGITEVL